MTHYTWIDEKLARRSGWVDDARIVLADRQAWSFPIPRARLVPAGRLVLAWTVGGRPDRKFGEQWNDAFDRYRKTRDDPESPARFLTRVSGEVLQRNYDLTADQAVHLVRGGFLDRDDHRGHSAAAREIRQRVIQPALDDLTRTRAAWPPVAENGIGCIVGLN